MARQDFQGGEDSGKKKDGDAESHQSVTEEAKKQLGQYRANIIK